jgi:hypothetical protein
VANTLAYYDTAKIMAVKSFTIQALGKDVDKASIIKSKNLLNTVYKHQIN